MLRFMLGQCRSEALNTGAQFDLGLHIHLGFPVYQARAEVRSNWQVS